MWAKSFLWFPNLRFSQFRGKSNRREVVSYRSNFNENINLLQSGRLSLSLDLGEYRFFKVYDPKERLISQHLANFYLGHLDHWIKENRRIKPYLRYMDDFLVFAEQISLLKNELYEIEKFLASELKLELKEGVQLNRCSQGIPFLGFRIFSDRLLLSPQNRKRFVAKFRFYEKEWQRHCWSDKTLQRHMAALVGSTEIADAYGFRKDIINRYGISF